MTSIAYAIVALYSCEHSLRMKYFQYANEQGDQYKQVYECCLSNHNMGWPHYVASQFLEANDTLAVLYYTPGSYISATTGLSLIVKGSYPFDNVVTINYSGASNTTVLFRGPGWLPSPMTINNSQGSSVAVLAGSLGPVVLRNAGTLTIVLPMEVALARHYNNSAVLSRGPLVYAVDLDSQATGVEQCPPSGEVPSHSEFVCAVTLNQQGFSYALAVSREQPSNVTYVAPSQAPVYGGGQGPFFVGPHLPHLEATFAATAAPWREAEQPMSPVQVMSRSEVLVKLWPYGAANVRLTELLTYEYELVV
jgi:DUF1680 family protein